MCVLIQRPINDVTKVTDDVYSNYNNISRAAVSAFVVSLFNLEKGHNCKTIRNG